MALFFEKGCNDTSYADIAAACGLTRSVVQYYFPKKEAFVQDLATRYLDAIVANIEVDAEAPLMTLCVTGLVHYGELLRDAALRRFYIDLLSTPSLVFATVNHQGKWAAGLLADQPVTGVSLEDQLAVHILGSYDLIAKGWAEGRNLTAEYVERACFVPFCLALGYDLESAEAILKDALQEYEERYRETTLSVSHDA